MPFPTNIKNFPICYSSCLSFVRKLDTIRLPKFKKNVCIFKWHMIYYYTRIIVGASQSGDNYFRFDWQKWYWLFFTVPAPAPSFPTTKEHKNERGRQTMWIVHSTSRISWTKSPYPRFFLVNVSERTRTDFGVFLIPWFVSSALKFIRNKWRYTELGQTATPAAAGSPYSRPNTDEACRSLKS